ncbi:MAG: DnaJ domain-containing protein [Syntrophobacteraceae bacterium]
MAPKVPLEKDYRTLGLEPGAKISEVKRAYRSLAKKWHPDRHQLEPREARAAAEKKFREIDEAYRRISKSRGNIPPVQQGGGPGAPKPEAPSHTERSGAAAWAWRLGAAKFFEAVFRFTRRSRFRARPTAIAAAALFLLIVFLPFLSPVPPDQSIDVLQKRMPAPPHRSAPPSARPPETVAIPPASPPALPEPEAPENFFTLGSTASRVLRVQGRPTQVLGDTWTYGVSEVHFKNGRVSGYNNFDGALRVKLEPGAFNGPAPRHITLGSTRQQVLLVQGTPTQVRGNRWYYGFAELIFQNGLVAGYDNYFGTLKMLLRPSTATEGGKHAFYFTRGSTPDEVLAAQGTPTAVHDKRWSYGFDFVLFQHGKVSGVIDSDGALHFIN